MKTFKVKIEFIGLAGKYISESLVKARTYASARKKAYQQVGDRSYNSIEITEAA